MAVLAVGVAGCGPRLPGVVAEGERVAIGIENPDAEVCAGTLAAFDSHVAYVESELGIAVPRGELLEVHVVSDPSPWCADSVACYLGGWVDGTVISSAWARPVWHELVHHVVARSDVGMTDRFLSEGLASALGDDWCPPAPVLEWDRPSLRELFAQETVPYEHYPVGARFVDFVRRRHGTEALVGLARCLERGDPLPIVARCVDAMLGEDLDALTEEFRSARVDRHANPALCRGEAIEFRGGRLEVDTSLACEDPTTVDTFEVPGGRETALLVDVPAPGMYRIALSADGDVDLTAEPCFCPAGLEPLRLQPTGEEIFFAEGGVHRLALRTDDPATSWVSLKLVADRG